MTVEPQPRLLYLVTEDWYFVSHRLPMARAAKKAGYEVHVATRVRDCRASIEAEGFVLHSLQWQRGKHDPLAFLRAVRDVRLLYREMKPALAHHVAMVPTVVGSLAALRLPIVRLNALAGLGFVFISRSIGARLLRPLLVRFMRRLIGNNRAAVLVQNGDDRALMTAIGIDPAHIFLIPGSGVDTDRLQPLPVPEGPITIAYVGRLLADKGLRPLVRAHALLAKRGEPIRLLIAGEPDPSNPGSILPSEIDTWRSQKGIEVLGHVPVAGVWAKAHIAVLPSRREGLPLSLLEAAACGRPMVATDVAGCRDIARDGVNALLVPPDDPEALADAIARLARDAALRAQFGAAGRQLVEGEFSSERIGREIVALYDRLLQRTKDPSHP
jgi:glycosyltransferase involved in cell wall biosynthesis